MAETPWRQSAAPPGAPNKFKSDFADHRPEPPACVQNAMLTKDKKPFTYTPGGIDLSEIRSPRMARRLERNAMSEGVTPSQQVHPNQQRTGPLPPSALAAMQPQLPVQVFPSGKIPPPPLSGPPPPPHCGPPPPPPPPMRAPGPLPLDSFERPDMTKIIPDNPMALLRKTQGPVVKQDPILNKQNYANNQQNDNNFNTQRPLDTKIGNRQQVGSIYVPPVNQNAIAPQSPQFTNQRDSPTGSIPAPPAFYKRQPSVQQNEPQTPPYVLQSKQPPSFDTAALPQRSESPKVTTSTLNKAQAPWLKQRSQSQEVPEWATNDHRAVNANNDEYVQVNKPKQQRPWSQKSTEKPDPDGWVTIEQNRQEPREWQTQQPKPQYQQPKQSEWQERQIQPPKQPESQTRKAEQSQWQPVQVEPPQRQPEQTNWQQKQQEAQPWRHNQQTDTYSKRPVSDTHSPPVYTPQMGGVRQQIQNREIPQEYYPNEKVEVVIVNDPPAVYQHPGQTQRVQQQPSYAAQNQNVRIIPIQMEGQTSNGHSNNDPRYLNRQLSWNSTPTQSNTFKVLQKITHTDGENDETDYAVTEHSPKTHQNFPQQNVHNRMKLNQADQELMNKFKQGIDQDNSIHKESDPRYRGPHIPSKAFKLLQNMTGGENDQSISLTVPHQDEPVNNNYGPKVRTIPIQIEGDGSRRAFVPPSEQTVAEPKKYMGSAIPSRSFKILQAMTAPDQCGPDQSDL